MGIPGQAWTTLLPPGVGHRRMFLPGPVPALDRARLLGAIPFQPVAECDRAPSIPGGRGVTAVVAPGGRSDRAQRPVDLLGPPTSTPGRVPVAVPRRPPQC